MAETIAENAFQESVLLDPRRAPVHGCMERCSSVLSILKAWWKLLVLVLTPILLLPLPLGLSRVADDQVRGMHVSVFIDSRSSCYRYKPDVSY